jgi:hypothetical protein
MRQRRIDAESDAFKLDLIRVERRVNAAVSKNTLDSCPFHAPEGCKIKPIRCRYGLTEIEVPAECPLRRGPVMTTVTLIEHK